MIKKATIQGDDYTLEIDERSSYVRVFKNDKLLSHCVSLYSALHSIYTQLEVQEWIDIKIFEDEKPT